MENEYYAMCEGKVVRDIMILEEYATIRIHPKLKGGKGGFGAKLKT